MKKISHKLVCLAAVSMLLTACQQEANPEKETKPEQQSKKTPVQQEQQSAALESDKAMDDKLMPDKTTHSLADDKQLWHQGTIKYFNLEGGFYGLITENGNRYLPLNLAKEFHQNGAVVKFTGKAEPGMMTIQQWGTPFTITDIKLIKAGTKTVNQDLL